MCRADHPVARGLRAVFLVCLLPALAGVAASQCAAPSGVAGAESPACEEGPLLGSGSNCTVLCKSGYSPSEAVLSCGSDGLLEPPTFQCQELYCDAPTNISNIDSPSCLEGTFILPGSSCTPRCKCGFKPSEASLSCSRGELSPEAFSCIPTPCVNVVTAAASSGALAPPQITCALTCTEPQGPIGWEYLLGYSAAADKQAPFLTDQPSPAAPPPLVAGALDLSQPVGWCNPRCGAFAVYYATSSPGLERIARALFGHLPCIDLRPWDPRTSRRSALVRADLLVITHEDLVDLPSDALAAAGLAGAIVLVDFGCRGHTVEGARPPALTGWEANTLCVGADRGSAASSCGAFLEVPPGALSLAMRGQGDLANRLKGLQATSREPPVNFTGRKLLAYVDDVCEPLAEVFFNGVAEDAKLLSIGAVEALGKCHGSHPELSRLVAAGSRPEAMKDYQFVMVFEKSADSLRQCPRYISSVALDALASGAIPVIWSPEEGSAVLNPDATIWLPPWSPIAAEFSSAINNPLGGKLSAAALREHAASRWFAWDTSVRGVPHDLGREAAALADAILRNSPHKKCVELTKDRMLLREHQMKQEL
ncbi:unnamed protein product [Polarella glacialis]|uniref:Uncharacterized protein n=1 Tax=Polarella glacialis TaxID=89957 RepID=A0A813K5L7_POLGL|nr:unnamed protein product [Polarella glacialis]